MPDPVGPLASVSADALTLAFAADPLELTDAVLDTIVIELRRRRNAFLAQEAAKALNKKPKAAKAPAADAVEHAALDKPPAELTSTDLFGEDD